MEVPSMFLNKILSGVAKSGASSLHFSAGSPPMVRVDGKLSSIESESVLTSEFLKKLIDSFIEEDERTILEKKKEVVMVRIFSDNLRFRINIFYQKGLPSISFNYISGFIRPWEKLNFPQKVNDFVKLDSGLIVIAGTNDSGRTTTAVSFLEEVNKNQKKYIITLERPIEYLFINKKSMIEQRQVGRDVETFANGLTHCMEEDVDIVYINETVREFHDIVPIVLDLASGNCLVILEINADNSIRALEALLETNSSEATRYNLADVLAGVISQKLLPKIGGGMALATEILTVSSPVKSLIREGNIYQIENIVQTSREEGMISMRKSIDNLVNNGQVKLEDTGVK